MALKQCGTAILHQTVCSSLGSNDYLCTRLYGTVRASTLRLGSGSDNPLLIQLPERAWGAPPELPTSALEGLPGVDSANKIAVLRDAFSAYDQPLRPLDTLIRQLGNGAVAVAAEVTLPHTRVVVDEYTKEAATGSFKLATVATDLLRFLKAQGTRAAIVPDVTSTTPSAAVSGVTQGVRQSSNEVLMVAPTAFGFNEQAAQDNSFMHDTSKGGQEASSVTRQVLKEIAGLHHQLTEVAGVKVTLFEHSLAHGTPDACFPNNWFSTHPASELKGEGTQGEPTLVLYPMKHPNRAAERRPDIIRVLQQRGYGRVVDYTQHEHSSKALEGTGVLVLDRVNRVAYAALSERADEGLAQQWVHDMGYKELVAFRAFDARGKAVYHTNVMMGVGTGVAIVCADSVKDAKERQHLLASLAKTHEVVTITQAQMDALCGNTLEVEDGRGLPALAMSTQAYRAFTPDQLSAISRHTASIIHAPIDTLERVGGGSVRCTLAELF